MDEDKTGGPEESEIELALARLSNEVLGMQFMEHGLRDLLGNTNYTLLIQRATEARMLLAEKTKREASNG